MALLLEPAVSLTDPTLRISVVAIGWPDDPQTANAWRGSTVGDALRVSLPNNYSSRFAPALRREWRRPLGEGAVRPKIVTWLILPVVICLSQRLSHACLSISNYTVKLRMAH